MDIDTRSIKKMVRKYKLKLLILFGSQARGMSNVNSDVDVAFFPSQPLDEEALHADLMAFFHRDALDLVNLKRTHNTLLCFEILHTGKVLYEEKKGLKSTMEWQSYCDYIDFKKYFTLQEELIDKRIAKLVA